MRLRRQPQHLFALTLQVTELFNLGVTEAYQSEISWNSLIC